MTTSRAKTDRAAALAAPADRCSKADVVDGRAVVCSRSKSHILATTTERRHHFDHSEGVTWPSTLALTGPERRLLAAIKSLDGGGPFIVGKRTRRSWGVPWPGDPVHTASPDTFVSLHGLGLIRLDEGPVGGTHVSLTPAGKDF